MGKRTFLNPSIKLFGNPKLIIRNVLIVTAYLCMFIVLDLFSKKVSELHGVIVCYPPAGLTYALLIVFGVRFMPLVTIALLIDSVFIFRMPQPFYLLFLWALAVSSIYCLTAGFLRRWIHIDWQLRKSRDVIWLVATTLLTSALLAMLSVLGSAMSSTMPQTKIFQAIMTWWISETTGVLTGSPFLLMYVMPYLKRFSERQPFNLPAHQPAPRSTLLIIGQASSIALLFYWVFGVTGLTEFQSMYLITLPLIWIVLTHGSRGITIGLLIVNFGASLALSIAQFDLAYLNEFSLLLLINCIIGLSMGAVVTERKQIYQKSEKQNQKLLFQNEEKEKRAAELVIANKEIRLSLEKIQALHKIDNAITGSLDLALTLSVVVEQAKTQLNIDAVTILLFNKYTHILGFASGIGFRSKAIERLRLRFGEGLAGQAALERKTVSATGLVENNPLFVQGSLLVGESFLSCFATPLIAKGQVTGVLEVFNRSPFTPDENWLDFFKILAGQVAIAVDSANLFTELKQSNEHLFAAYNSTLEGWSRALDLRDKETEGHTQRVVEMTVKLGYVAGIAEEELLHMRRGALLHDIGKMGIPDNILLKAGSLTDEEWVVMRKHPVVAFELLSPIAYLRPAMDIPYCHHEKWDGSGYPRGLKGEQIPLAARLFSVVDVWDALCSNRPYRQGWPQEKVLEHIRSLAGTQFDPKAVELFLEEMNKEAKTTIGAKT